MLAVLALSLVNLAVEVRNGGPIAALSGALVFAYVGVVLAVSAFTDRPFDPRIQIALFGGLIAYWTYDYFSRDNTLSILLVAFGLVVLAQQARRLRK